MNNRADRIEQTLADTWSLQHLQVIDESGNHSVPDGAQTHFKVIMVADAFDGTTRIARHRLVNDALQTEFSSGLHALSIHVYSPAEWRARHGSAPMSPPCLGGSKSSG